MIKRLFFGLLALSMASPLLAQSGTSSPYSQYGLGVLTDQSQGFSRGMNGVGLGLRKGNIVNTLNPASYSAVDSLSMIFDMGLSGKLTNYKEGAVSQNITKADFEYVAASFRLMPNVGVSFGMLPLTNVGYEYSTSTYLNESNTVVLENYSGNGGFHQAYIGAGWRVLKPLSIGFNAAYLWGSYKRSVTTASSESALRTLSKSYEASVSSYNLQVGLQWEQRLTKSDMVTLGATWGIGHKLGADPSCSILTSDAQTGVSDTTKLIIANGLKLPTSLGVGLSYQHADKLTAAADFTMQKWGDIDFPHYNAAKGDYSLQPGLLKDRYVVNAGVDYVPGAMSRNFLKRVHYRCGVGYATPYYKIDGADGPKETSISAGFGIPLQNSYNNRSVLNISAQWARTSATDLITENVFRINIGLTFNERWFAKWKID